MSHVQLESAAQHEVVFAVPAHLENGENSEATACFAVSFDINDHGIGLEFADSRRLAELLQKKSHFIQTPCCGQTECL